MYGGQSLELFRSSNYHSEPSDGPEPLACLGLPVTKHRLWTSNGRCILGITQLELTTLEIKRIPPITLSLWIENIIFYLFQFQFQLDISQHVPRLLMINCSEGFSLSRTVNTPYFLLSALYLDPGPLTSLDTVKHWGMMLPPPVQCPGMKVIWECNNDNESSRI